MEKPDRPATPSRPHPQIHKRMIHIHAETLTRSASVDPGSGRRLRSRRHELSRSKQQAVLRLTFAYVSRLEDDCDMFNADLPALRSFVLPGQSTPSSELHFARAVCRRAERQAWRAVDGINR